MNRKQADDGTPMPGPDEVNGVPEDDASETERPIQSGRSETEEEREDPTRAPNTKNGAVSAEREGV